MARAASAFAISTKPKPRGLPVSRSVIRDSFSTVPWGANNARTESSVAVNGRFPTYNLVKGNYSQKEKDTGRKGLPPGSKSLRGWRSLAKKHAGIARCQGQTSRKVTIRRAEYSKS